jgi:hypothetical protein
MTIREDSGLLLKFLYDQYTSGHGYIDSKTVYEHFAAWGEDRAGRINRALNYLRDLNALKIKLFIGNYEGVYNFIIMGLTDTGIELIEKEGYFQAQFGFAPPNPP